MTPEPTRYSVGRIGRAGPDLARLESWAEAHGLRTFLIKVLQQAIQNLETTPREWGDPYTNYRGLQGTGYGKTILIAKLRIEYVVHDTEPFVWLTAIRPLAGSPFAGSEGA